MNVNLLIAKAMSTSSEEEAIACLLMARKKGGNVNITSAKLVDGKDIDWWANIARELYNKKKAYKAEAVLHYKECIRLKIELNKKNAVSDSIRNFALISLSCILLVGLFIL